MKASAALGLLLLGLALGWLVARPGTQPVNRATLALRDSLRGSQAAYDTLQRQTAEGAIAFRDTTVKLAVRVAALQRVAGASGRRADSLASLAESHPMAPDDSSAHYWAAAYVERSREADSLRIATALGFQTMRDAQIVASRCLSAQIAAEGRLSQMEALQQGLEKALKHAKRPSGRTFLLGLGLGALAGHLLLR